MAACTHKPPACLTMLRHHLVPSCQDRLARVRVLARNAGIITARTYKYC